MVRRSFEFEDFRFSELVKRLEDREEKELTKVFKVCPRCGERKPLFYFSKDKRNTNGKGSICRVCRSKESLKYYYENRDKLLTKIKEYQDGKDRKKYFQDYKIKHKEYLKKMSHRWYMKNRKRIKRKKDKGKEIRTN